MNIRTHPISPKFETCAMCNRNATVGLHIEAMDDMGLLDDGLPGLSMMTLEAIDEIEFDIFLCRDHAHLATSAAIEDRADFLMNE